MAELSPQAQAVLDAADSTLDQAGTTRQGIAAALRAAADLVPDHQMSAHMLHAIADELENHQ